MTELNGISAALASLAIVIPLRFETVLISWPSCKLAIRDVRLFRLASCVLSLYRSCVVIVVMD
jgi:hypothetical protein